MTTSCKGAMACVPALALLLLRAAAPQAEPSRGILAGLPGSPGPNVARIKDLGDGAWLDLGPPAADPKWGRARGRSWSARMPYAPDLRGAFLFGEGVHGWAKPDGRCMDDLWLYDVNGHRWVCCYPGADVNNIDLAVDADGFEADKDGQRLPVASMVHGYEMVAYDSDRKQFLSMPCPGGYSKPLNEKHALWWKGRGAPSRAGASPWTFGVASGRWDRRATETKGPASGFGDALVYVSSRKQAFFRHGQEAWFYDAAANRWSEAAAKGPKLPFGIDGTCCYDPVRERVYLGGGSYPVAPEGTNAFFYYDLKAGAWVDPAPKGAPCGGSNSYNTNVAAMNYDSANDVVVLFRFEGEEKERGVFIYDPVTNAWTAGSKALPKAWKRCRNSFYDPVLNAHFVHAAGDSADDGSMFVYRFKKGR